MGARSFPPKEKKMTKGTYTAEIRRAETIPEKYIAVVWFQEEANGPRSCVDVRNGNSVTCLSNWAHSFGLSHNPVIEV